MLLKTIMEQMKGIPNSMRKYTLFLPSPLKKITNMVIDLSEILILKFIPPEVEPPPAFNNGDKVSEVTSHLEKVEGSPSNYKDDPLNNAFNEAIKEPQLLKNQKFKVLAILWKAEREGKTKLTAKEISKLGEELKISMLPTNIRKVIREQLGEYINVEKVGSGKNIKLLISINDKGRTLFEQEFLKKYTH